MGVLFVGPSRDGEAEYCLSGDAHGFSLERDHPRPETTTELVASTPGNAGATEIRASYSSAMPDVWSPHSSARPSKRAFLSPSAPAPSSAAAPTLVVCQSPTRV